MSDAVLGYGITYAIDDGTTGSNFVVLGEVFDIELAADEVEEVDVTHYTSANRTREFIAGMINTGEATFSLNWIPGNATDVYLRDLLVSGATRNHRVIFPDGIATVVFPGFIKGRTPSLPVDDKLTCQFTVKRAGPETWT